MVGTGQHTWGTWGGRLAGDDRYREATLYGSGSRGGGSGGSEVFRTLYCTIYNHCTSNHCNIYPSINESAFLVLLWHFNTHLHINIHLQSSTDTLIGSINTHRLNHLLWLDLWLENITIIFRCCMQRIHALKRKHGRHPDVASFKIIVALLLI